MSRKKKLRRKKLRRLKNLIKAFTASAVLLAGIFLFVFGIKSILFPQKKGTDSAASASAAGTASTTAKEASTDAASTAEAATAETAIPVVPAEPPERIPVDFEELWKTAPDAYAWILIPETNINYPVCQSGPDRELDFYLSHRPDGTAEFAGSIYSQYYNKKDFSDPDTILYGHDMSDGSMFRTLHLFDDQDFFDRNREVLVYLPDKVLHYRIFAAYNTNDDHILDAHDHFRDPAVFIEYLRDIFTGESVYLGYVDESVELTAQSRILTLSTCNTREDQRFLVQCYLERTADGKYIPDSADGGRTGGTGETAQEAADWAEEEGPESSEETEELEELEGLEGPEETAEEEAQTGVY